MNTVNAIPKNPVRRPDEDYARLMKLGLQYIEGLGSALWTDLNEHDPGVTILEALCYSISELAYRASFDINDLLADPTGKVPLRAPFFSAKNILTHAPLTINDYRKLLIDIIGVKNAWLLTDDTIITNTEGQAHEIPIYIDCESRKLSIAESSPANRYGQQMTEIKLQGLYTVLIDLESDPEAGDLNLEVIDIAFHSAEGKQLDLEMSLPAWEHYRKELADVEISKIEDRDITHEFTIGKNEGDLPGLKIEFPYDGKQIKLTARPALQQQPENLDSITDFLSNKDNIITILRRILSKIHKVNKIMREVCDRLNDNRNLCEDFRSVQTIKSDELAVYCDIDIAPEADINAVYASVLYTIDQCLDPGVNFYLLKEMLEKNINTDEIFEGPKLDHGFIDSGELAKADLPGKVYVSKLVSALLSVKNIKAIRNFRISAYNNSILLPQPSPDVIAITKGHKVVMSAARSGISLYKGQFPLTPDPVSYEANYSQLVTMGRRNKISGRADDIVPPAGNYYPVDSYTTIQNLFPANYGIGKNKLPSSVTEERKAQVRQLKAYLCFFDQLLADFFSQLKNAGNLFAAESGAEEIVQTYYAQFIAFDDSNVIYSKIDPQTNLPGANRLINTIDKADSTVNIDSPLKMPTEWQHLFEDGATYIDRRNRFLDHLMARFAESFNNYALLSYRYEVKTNGEEARHPSSQIEYKIDFLRGYAKESYRRGKAFNYTLKRSETGKWNMDNVPGLEKKLSLLIGMQYDKTDYKSSINSLKLFEDGESSHLDETIYVIEHILLRPRNREFALADTGCHTGDCALQDPYSFQITILLKAEYWMDLNYRAYFNYLVSMEAPAHAVVRIFWLGENVLSEFKTVFINWIEALGEYAGEHSAINRLRTANDKLVEVIYKVQSAYPVATLDTVNDWAEMRDGRLGRIVLKPEDINLKPEDSKHNNDEK